MTRYLLLALLIATPTFAQTGRGATPSNPTTSSTRPKVIATPKPAPELPAPATPPPAPRKRRPVSPESASAAYIPKVKAVFAKRWTEAVQPHMDDYTQGKVAVTFKLDADGKVVEFAVTENTSNEAFAKFCEQFVRESEFEKPPAKALTEGRLEIPFTFWIY